MRFPSTLITLWSGSTRAPDRRPIDSAPARADHPLAVPAAADPRFGQDLLQPDAAGNVGQAVAVLALWVAEVVVFVVVFEVTVGRSHSRCPRCPQAGTARGRAGPPGWP